jgi:hypothetical protein
MYGLKQRPGESRFQRSLRDGQNIPGALPQACNEAAPLTLKQVLTLWGLILLIILPPPNPFSRTRLPWICLGRPHPLATKALRNLNHRSVR